MKKNRIVFIIIIIITAALVFAFKFGRANKKDNLYGGSFRWGVYHKPTLINPVLTSQSISASLIELIFNGLVRSNSKGEIEPDLAESWDISPDGLVYTFHLRKGVKFHDGHEFTAEDVKFTYDKIIDPDFNSTYKDAFQIVKLFEASGKYTFKVILNNPSSAFLYRMKRYIIPEHLFQGKDLVKCYFNYHPVGTGPFKFKSWTEDNQITLSFNPQYYEGRPFLDEIVIIPYADSREVFTALMREEIDCAEFIERKDYEIIKNDLTFKSYAVPVDLYYVIFYNPQDVILSDLRVRYALAYALDLSTLIQKVSGGYGLICTGPFYPQSLGFNPQIKPFEYNINKAEELLTQAGWNDEDLDGIREKDSQKLELRILVDKRNTIYLRLIMVIRQQLQEAGIKVKVFLYDDDKILTKEFINKNNIQAQLKFFLGGLDPDLVSDDWCSKMIENHEIIWEYQNQEVKKLFESGKVVLDKSARNKIYQKINQLIYTEQPVCFLYYPFIFHGVSAKFANTDKYFNLNMPNYKIKDFFIKGR